jgi:hypothetical protein
VYIPASFDTTIIRVPRHALRRFGAAEKNRARSMKAGATRSASPPLLGLRSGPGSGPASRIARLKTPERIQDFVNTLRWNFEKTGPTGRSVAETLRHGTAHCVEAAFVAAYALWVAGEPPLVMDMGAARGDVDHVVALFRRGRCWGAISKSNSPFLRYRDPIYRSLRELSLSFFPQYVKRRRKTLRTYSAAVDMRRFDPAAWVTHPGFCHEVIDALTAARHFSILPRGGESHLRPIDEIEARSNLLKEYET